MESKSNLKHLWKFSRFGGFDQVILDTGDDIANLDALDQKLWVALSCPVEGIECDRQMLLDLDANGDGLISAPEILQAIDWLKKILVSFDVLLSNSSVLPLAAINQRTPEGKAIVECCRDVLQLCESGCADAISLEDVANYKERVGCEQVVPNCVPTCVGTGFISVDAVGADVELRNCFDAIARTRVQTAISCGDTAEGDAGNSAGQVANDATSGAHFDPHFDPHCDPHCDPRIDESSVDAFFTTLPQVKEWMAQASTRLPRAFAEVDNAVLALGAYRAVEEKIEDYFTRCRLVAFDPTAREALNPSHDTYAALSVRNLSQSLETLRALPLAIVKPDSNLCLDDGLNPSWTEAISAFKRLVIIPLLGNISALSPEQWQTIRKDVECLKQWYKECPDLQLAGLGFSVVSRIRPEMQERLRQLFIQNDSCERVDDRVIDVAPLEKVLRLSKGLHSLLNNFVSFRDFYTGDGFATFQCGTLYLDARSCSLCVKVNDLDSHVALASLSRTFLTYCQCSRPDSAKGMIIAAAFTGGDSDNLIVGRNGIFYDRQGRDWHAKVIKIVSNPISIREAFFLPYKRIGRMLTEQIEKFATAKDKAVADNSSAIAKATPALVSDNSAAPKAPFDIGKFAGIFAAIGLAVGAIGTAIATVVTGFISLSPLQMPLALAGIVLAISGPSMLIAWLKLRQRNVAPLLDASGWAINARAKMNILFGEALTKTPKLPPGALRLLHDPYAEKPNVVLPQLAMLFLLVTLGAVVWISGFGFSVDVCPISLMRGGQ